MKQKSILTTLALSAAFLGATALASAQALAVNQPTAGTPATITGSGAAANGPVEIWVNGVSQGTFQADGTGAFSINTVDLAENDVVYATASQVWNFNTDGDPEGWYSGTDGTNPDTLTVSGGSLILEESNTDTNLTYAVNPTILAQSVTRVFEIRYRVTSTSFNPGDPQASFYDSGSGFVNFGASPLTSAGVGQWTTAVFSANVDNTGAANSWETNPINQIVFGANGFTDGDTIEIDYIRLNEYFSWDFNNDGDFMSFVNTTGDTVDVTGGSLNVAAAAGGTSPTIAYQIFGFVDTTAFTFLEYAITSDTASDPNNVMTFNYFSNDGSFTGGGYQAFWADDATPQTAFLDFSTTPLYGPTWGSNNVTLNTPGTVNLYFATNAGETASIDYIRLRPGPIFGPSPSVSTLAASSVSDWMYIE